jgi:DNA-3-methyladenine glycosylase
MGLLGAQIETTVDGVRCAGVIVETEAYTGPDDDASHAHIRFGITRRNAPMYGPPGFAYVYRIYGVHWCFNAVTGEDGFPAAVLVRAARPVAGIEAMRIRRAGRQDRDLMRGPGNLARALGITDAMNRLPLHRPPLTLRFGEEHERSRIAVGPRIGITRAVDAPLRFWIDGERHVSGHRIRADPDG